MGENLDYTQLMRKSTRKIHSISDTLINAKLAFGNYICLLIDNITSNWYTII